MVYFERSKFCKSLILKKNFSYMASSFQDKIGYLFCQMVLF